MKRFGKAIGYTLLLHAAILLFCPFILVVALYHSAKEIWTDAYNDELREFGDYL